MIFALTLRHISEDTLDVHACTMSGMESEAISGMRDEHIPSEYLQNKVLHLLYCWTAQSVSFIMPVPPATSCALAVI